MNKSKVDAVTLELVRNSFINICEHMRVTVERTAHSPTIYEVVDFGTGIIDKEHRIIAENTAQPTFLGMLQSAVAETDKIIGHENLNPGDIIICNDPFSGGFCHTPDVACVCPVFYEDELCFFTAFKGHLSDMGGIYPGGWFNNTTSTYQEGLALPPVKLYIKGEENEDLVRVIRRNIRYSTEVFGDMRAMVAAVRLGAKQIQELIKKYSLAMISSSIEQMMNYARREAQKAVMEIPDGYYSDHYYADGGGDDSNPLTGKLRVQVNIKVDGDHMTMDFDGTESQTVGPVNAPFPAVVSLARYGYKSLTVPTAPSIEGHFDQLTIIEPPKGSMFNAQRPAATSLLWPMLNALPDLILKALAPALPERIRAGHFGDVCADIVYGQGPDGVEYLLAEPTAGGYGGKPNGEDGEVMFAMTDGDTYNVPAEIREVRHPIRVVRYELIPDLCGAGKFRGGVGVRKEYTPVGHDCRLTATFERRLDPGWGLHGGEPGKPNQLVIYRSDGKTETYGKVTDLEIKEGDIMSFQGGGGGGFGNPLERDYEKVRADVENGYISINVARDSYGVVFATDMQVDEMETNKLRQELQARKKNFLQA